jgi:hypothetical protein
METQNKGEKPDSYNPRELFKDDSTTDLESGVWLKELRDKIYTMFRTPMKQEFSDEVFRWVSALCMCQPRFSWLCSNGEVWTKEEAKIFSLIVRLSINELHMVLPLIRRHLTSGEEVEREDGKVTARPAEKEEYDSFGVHLHIFEDSIQALCHGQTDDGKEEDSNDRLTDCLEPDELKSLLERLREIVSELFDYLEDVHKHWPTLLQDAGAQQFLAAQGALRAICAWISEDHGCFRSQCKNFLIEHIVKNLLISHRLSSMNLDLLVTALHSICSGDRELMSVLKETSDYRAALQNYLDHVQQERYNDDRASSSSREERRKEKRYKLQCGLVKDLLT